MKLPKKSTKLKSLIAYVPDEIESNDFQINILVLKGKMFVELF